MNPSDCAGPTGVPDTDRTAERMVLAAYRQCAGARRCVDERSVADLPGLLADALTPRSARIVAAALCDLVDALERCARCPLHVPAVGSDAPGADETLILGLIAAIQAGDDHVAELCLTTLACPTRCQPVALAAGNLALILKGLGKTVSPMSLPAIRRIAGHKSAMRQATADAIALHPATIH